MNCRDSRHKPFQCISGGINQKFPPAGFVEVLNEFVERRARLLGLLSQLSERFDLFIRVADVLQLRVGELFDLHFNTEQLLIDQPLYRCVVIPCISKGFDPVGTISKITFDYTGNNLIKLFQFVGHRSSGFGEAGCLSDKAADRLRENIRSKPAALQRLLKGTSLGNHLIRDLTVLLTNLDQLILKLCQGNPGRTDLVLYFTPIRGKAALEQIISCIGGIGDDSAKKFGHLSKEFLGLLKVANHDLPACGPSRLSALLERVHQLSKGFNVLSRRKRFLTNLGSLIRIPCEGFGQDLGSHPLRTQRVIEQQGRVKQVRNMAIQVRGSRLILLTDFNQSTHLHSGIHQLLLKLHRCHIGILDGLPVNQLDITGGQGLAKVIHGAGRFIGICAGNCRHVGDTLNSGHSVIQLYTSIGELANVLGHVCKGIDGLVGVSIQLIQLLIDPVQTLAGAGHDGLDRAHLQLILVEACCDRLYSKGGGQPFSSIQRRVGDVGKSSHCHDLQRGELQLYRLDGLFKSRHIALFSSVIDVLQSLCGTV